MNHMEAQMDRQIEGATCENEALRREIGQLRAALLSCARQAERLKKPCSMDPESAQAVRNAQYQSISTTAHIALGTILGPRATHPWTDMDKERIRQMAVEAGLADISSYSGQLITEYGPCEDQLIAFAQAVARECLQDDDALIEAMAEHTYGHTRADAIEWAKEDKFDSHCQQARELLKAMRPVISERFGLGD